MKRARQSDGMIARLSKVVGYVLTAGVGFVAMKEMPSVGRYLAMKRMAKSHDGVSPGVLPPPNCPQYAQAPRRAGTRDGN